MSVVKSIQLGSKRFLEVNDEYDVVIKAEGNTKRAHFTASRWARFIGEIPEVDDAIKRFCDDKPTAFKKHIGGKWYISVSGEVPCVDIRRWYMKDNSVHPTTIGIALTFGQWDKLKAAAEELQKELPVLAAISPCFHESQIDLIHCRECNPFDDFVEPCYFNVCDSPY